MDDNTFSFEILRHYGVISKDNAGWTLELNMMSWNGEQLKYDLRWWDEDHERMSRGVTLTKAEAQRLLTVMLEETGLLGLPNIVEKAINFERKWGKYEEDDDDLEEI